MVEPDRDLSPWVRELKQDFEKAMDAELKPLYDLLESREMTVKMAPHNHIEINLYAAPPTPLSDD